MRAVRTFDALTSILVNTLSERLLLATADVLIGLLQCNTDDSDSHAALADGDIRSALVEHLAGMLVTEPWSDDACTALIPLLAEACLDEDGDTDDPKRGMAIILGLS